MYHREQMDDVLEEREFDNDEGIAKRARVASRSVRFAVDLSDDEDEESDEEDEEAEGDVVGDEDAVCGDKAAAEEGPAPLLASTSGPHHQTGSASRPGAFDCIELDHFPQAFSHFTYRASGRRLLVCDLQGVLDEGSSPPRFRCTDPAIHYGGSVEGKFRDGGKFGRSDFGKKGMHRFFASHKCSKLCGLLGLDPESPFPMGSGHNF